MGEIRFEGRCFTLAPGETVLEGLERQGEGVPSSCRAGVCQSCVLRAVGGEVPAAAQHGLRETLRAQGYFLSCKCRPEGPLEVERGNAVGRFRATVASVEALNARVARLRVECEPAPAYFAGQFMNLVHPSGQMRSYSVASVGALESWLEFHVGLIPGGVMSTWVHEEIALGDTLEIVGPQGNCFYVAQNPEQPLFLLGTGTGLAPLYGIARDALAQGHQGPIHLFHGSLRREGLYLVEALRAMAAEWPQFQYHPCVLEGDGADGIEVAAIDTLAFERIPDLKGWRVFLCGPPDLVKKMQRATFLKGASMQEIFADAFLPAATATV